MLARSRVSALRSCAVALALPALAYAQQAAPDPGPIMQLQFGSKPPAVQQMQPPPSAPGATSGQVAGLVNQSWLLSQISTYAYLSAASQYSAAAQAGQGAPAAPAPSVDLYRNSAAAYTIPSNSDAYSNGARALTVPRDSALYANGARTFTPPLGSDAYTSGARAATVPPSPPLNQPAPSASAAPSAVASAAPAAVSATAPAASALEPPPAVTPGGSDVSGAPVEAPSEPTASAPSEVPPAPRPVATAPAAPDEAAVEPAVYHATDLENAASSEALAEHETSLLAPFMDALHVFAVVGAVVLVSVAAFVVSLVVHLRARKRV